MPDAPPAELAGAAVAVTGGAGFLGRRLVTRLREAGAARVLVLDRRPASRAPGALHAGPTERSEIVLGRCTDAELDGALGGITHLVHLAAEKHAGGAEGAAMLETNVLGTHALFEAARRAAVQRVVFASSLYAYGRDRGAPLDENEAPRPTTLYGISKLAGERLLERFVTKGGSGIALRYFFLYGPGQFDEGERPSFIAGTLARLARGEAPIIRGDGAQALDYVHVEDAVDATLRALALRTRFDVVNVGSGGALPVTDLLRTMQTIAGSTRAPERLPADATEGTLRVASTATAERVLGFRARTSLDEGLRGMWEAARRR